jgi:CxxC-x17-CxxC domain-containing protein
MRRPHVIGVRMHVVTRRSSVVCTGPLSAVVQDDPPALLTAFSPSMVVLHAPVEEVSPVGLSGPSQEKTRESMSMTTDLTLQCLDCGRDFAFSSGEQKFYASHGLTYNPSRCPECRAARKSARGSARAELAPYPRYIATCFSCGREALVPFLPRGDKPIYCSACFQQLGGGAGSASTHSYTRS